MKHLVPYSLYGLIFCILLQGAGCVKPEYPIYDTPLWQMPLEQWHYQSGDHPAWASSIFDASDWLTLKIHEGLPKAKQYWLRRIVTIPPDLPPGKQLVFMTMNIRTIGLLSASTVYWDGQILHENGQIGPDLAREIPGQYNFAVPIPRALATGGDHVLAIRGSNHHYPDKNPKSYLGLSFQDALEKSRQDNRENIILFVGIFATVALFNLIMFFGFKWRLSYLYLGLFCLFHAFKAYSTLYYFSDITFVDDARYGHFVDLPIYLGGLLLLAFLWDNFSLPRQASWLAGFTTLTLLAFVGHARVEILIFLTLVSFAVCAYALYRRKEDAPFIFVALIGYSIISYFAFQGIWQGLQGGYFSAILFFIIAMSLLLGNQIAKQNRQRQTALLRSARLESQMLKKNIQPHFIMNSLTTLQELLIDDPNKGTAFIQALAEEFRIFSRISDKQQIDVNDELAMCRAHLSIMEYRRDSRFILDVTGMEGGETIPPAVFHTLIENGITHGYENRRQGLFRLSKEITPDSIRYRLFNDSTRAAGPVTPGTGLNYVKARLQESWPARWQMTFGPVAGGWEVVIDLYREDSEK